jgi:protein tyrosine/serine phosphatase
MAPVKPRIFIPALLVLAGFLACRSAPPPTITTSGRPMAERIAGIEGLENFARIDAVLYRGAQPTAEGYRKLKEMGVKTVINFRSHHSYKKDIEAAGMACVELPLQADMIGSEPPTEEQLRSFFEIVLDPARQPVFIHCMGGKDRTGTLCAVYRMETAGWSKEEAIEEMQAFGFHDYYADLMKYVRGYELRGYSVRR